MYTDNHFDVYFVWEHWYLKQDTKRRETPSKCKSTKNDNIAQSENGLKNVLVN